MAGLTTAQERYGIAFEETTEDDWQSWFDPDALPASDDIPGELSVESAESMLLSGKVYWSHPGWIRDVGDVLWQWALDGQLVKVRLFADWLLETMSCDALVDIEFFQCLTRLGSGDFCEAFTGLSNFWPRRAEHYRVSLKWEMISVALDNTMRCRAEAAVCAAHRQNTGNTMNLDTLESSATKVAK